MTTKKKITVFSIAAILSVATIMTVISTQNSIEAQEEYVNDVPQGRTLSPFMFVVPEEYHDGTKYSGSRGGSPITELDRSNTVSIPMVIKSVSKESVNVDFHTTFGSDQIGEIKSIPGVTVNVEPRTMTLNPGEEQILTINIITDETVEDGTYRQSIVGRWDDTNGFLGTTVYFQIGEGSEKILSPRDVLKRNNT